MKAFLIRNQNRLPMLLAAVGFVIMVYLIASNIAATKSTLTEVKDTVGAVEQKLETERQLREERLVAYTTCLLRVPIEQRTDEMIADCRSSSGLQRETPVRPLPETNEGTTPATQGSVQPNQPARNGSVNPSSSSNNTPNQTPAQPDNSQPNVIATPPDESEEETSEERSTLGSLPVVGGVFDRIGL